MSEPDADGPQWLTWTESPAPCGWCEEPVQPASICEMVTHWEGGTWRRLPWHRECRVRSVLGGVNHLQGRCTCCGGTEPPDPPELTRRQAAIAAFELVFSRPPNAKISRYGGRNGH